MTTKLTSIILNHLPKERKIYEATDFLAHRNPSNEEFNLCHQEIIKALPEIEKEIVAEIKNQKISISNKDLEAAVGITKDLIINSLCKEPNDRI